MTWSRFKTHFYHNADLGVSLDISRIPFPDDYLASMEPLMQLAFAAMARLEGGAIANPDENRMVGHYWLRAPYRAPTPEITTEVTATLAAIKEFSAAVHSGAIAGPKGKFKNSSSSASAVPPSDRNSSATPSAGRARTSSRSSSSTTRTRTESTTCSAACAASWRRHSSS